MAPQRISAHDFRQYLIVLKYLALMTVLVPQAFGARVIGTLRQGQPWAHDVDVQIVLAELARERLAQRNDAALAGAIDGLIVFTDTTRIGSRS